MDAPTAPAKPTNPRHIPSALGVVAKGVYIVGGLGNALSIDLGDGVVQIDTGLDVIAAGEMMARLRLHTASPVTTIVYSHGHLGYNFGVQAWLDVAFFERGHTPPVVAQVSAAKLVERFKRTTPLMKLLIAMEYHGPIPTTPSALPLFTPTVTFTDRYPITGSQRTMEVFSAPSETDGSIGAWIPDVKVLYGGPGCISMLPDIGMPLSPFRDATRWADTLDLFASYKAETLVPQYGPVIQGATEVNDYLTGTSTALRYLDDQVVDHLNAGHNLNETIATMVYPPTIFAKAFLGATFGSLEDVVRSIWATYNGWWDRNPTDLRSVPQGQVGAAIRSAISDRALVLQRAAELQGAGEHRLALHVVDLLALAPGEDADIVLARKLKAALCYELADREEAYIAQSLYLTSGDVLLNPPTVPTGIR